MYGISGSTNERRSMCAKKRRTADLQTKHEEPGSVKPFATALGHAIEAESKAVLKCLSKLVGAGGRPCERLVSTMLSACGKS